jgi:ATP-dependent protease ClpP protease subunit
MPTLNDIQQTILNKKNTSQDEVRRDYLKKLSDYTDRDVIIYASAFATTKAAIIPGLLLSVVTDDMQGFMSAMHGMKRDKLDLILHSPGGSMEAAEQIVLYLRSKYKHIRAIVPQNAMSAATMLACACDTIVMGTHSAIGPIDPQVTFPTPNGAFTAPAQSILDEFEQAKREIVANPTTAILWIEKLRAYPHGFLSLCQTTIAIASEKVEQWLDTYMFASVVAGQKPGKKIASWLGDAKIHKTHGRPINAATAKAEGLIVEPLEQDQQLQELVLSVFHSTMVTFGVTNCVKITENQNGRGLYLTVEVKPLK